jgi:hypothetical protein
MHLLAAVDQGMEVLFFVPLEVLLPDAVDLMHGESGFEYHPDFRPLFALVF